MLHGDSATLHVTWYGYQHAERVHHVYCSCRVCIGLCMRWLDALAVPHELCECWLLAGAFFSIHFTAALLAWHWPVS